MEGEEAVVMATTKRYIPSTLLLGHNSPSITGSLSLFLHAVAKLELKAMGAVRPGRFVPIHIFAGARTTHMNFASSDAFQCRV